MTIRIANGAGFLGDRLDAPRRLVESAQVDYLTIEHLAELTLSILAHLRVKDPRAGYATDFVEILESLIPALRSQTQLHVIANSRKHCFKELLQITLGKQALFKILKQL